MNRSLRGLLLPGLATAIALAILLGLGFWQLDRKSWKEGLLAAIAARAHGPAGQVVPEADWPRWRATADEFRRVRLSGTFLHDKEVQLHGLAEERRGQPLQGFYVFTPLKREDGTIVVVNRGIVPTELRDPARRPAGQIGGTVEVVGLVRAPEARPAFVPGNEPGGERWFVRDLGEMVRARGLERAAPFYVDADSTPNPGGWPRGGQTRLNLPNSHLGYAITWFGIAATLVGVFGAFAWARIRSGDELQPGDADQDQPDAGEPGKRRRVAE